MSDATFGDGGSVDMTPDMLSAYLDDELTAVDRARVEARLTASAEWRAELDDVRAARDALRGLPSPDAPAGFWDAVLANVADADADADDAGVDGAGATADGAPVARPIPLAPRRESRRIRWIASAAAAVVALVAAVVIVPGRAEVRPNVTAVVAQHGAQSASSGDPVSPLAPVGPFAGFRR